MSSSQKHRRTTRNLATPKSYDLWLRWPIPPTQRIARWPRPLPPRPPRTPRYFPLMKDRAGARRQRAAAVQRLPGLLATLSLDFAPLRQAAQRAGEAVGAWMADLRKNLLYPVADWQPGSPPPVNLVQPPNALAPITAPDQEGGHPEGDTPS